MTDQKPQTDKVVRWEDSIEYFRAVDYEDPKDYLHAKIDWHEKELARLAGELKVKHEYDGILDDLVLQRDKLAGELEDTKNALIMTGEEGAEIIGCLEAERDKLNDAIGIYTKQAQELMAEIARLREALEGIADVQLDSGGALEASTYARKALRGEE